MWKARHGRVLDLRHLRGITLLLIRTGRATPLLSGRQRWLLNPFLLELLDRCSELWFVALCLFLVFFGHLHVVLFPEACELVLIDFRMFDFLSVRILAFVHLSTLGTFERYYTLRAVTINVLVLNKDW